jgi:hypothetical protein
MLTFILYIIITRTPESSTPSLYYQYGLNIILCFITLSYIFFHVLSADVKFHSAYSAIEQNNSNIRKIFFFPAFKESILQKMAEGKTIGLETKQELLLILL